MELKGEMKPCETSKNKRECGQTKEERLNMKGKISGEKGG